MERTIARAWQQALGIPSVGLTDNFFDLGAHSLTVAEVHAKLKESLGREIPLVDLFQFTTVRALAAHLSAQSSGMHTAACRLSERAARRRMAHERKAVSS
jgi:acyl carrier protein